MIGKTLYDFNSNKPDEISFTSGEELVGDLDVVKPHMPFKIFILSIAYIYSTYYSMYSLSGNSFRLWYA